MDYCVTCGMEDANAKTGFPEIMFEDLIEAKIWIEEEEYSARKTLNELHRELAQRET